MYKRLLVRATLFAACAFTQFSEATIVRFTTSLGTVDVNLYDELTPETVNNFLSYVDTGAYRNSIIHRSISDFIVQGGRFTFRGTYPIDDIVSGAPIVNEPEFSNIRGTIAMAKVGMFPDSATSEWFFNLSDRNGAADNPQSLDAQNGGFTVFGEVMTDDMDIIDAIANLPRVDFGGALEGMPLRNYSAEDAAAGKKPNQANFVLISNIEVVDPAINTLGNKLPAPNFQALELAEPETTSNAGGWFDWLWSN